MIRPEVVFNFTMKSIILIFSVADIDNHVIVIVLFVQELDYLLKIVAIN